MRISGCPVERGKRPQRRRVPGVEHVFVLSERRGFHSFTGFEPFGQSGIVLRQRVRVVARDIHIAFGVIPRGDAMAPPQLARDTPILNVDEPLVVGAGPVFGHKLEVAQRHGIEPALRQRFHFHEPLIGEHGLDNRIGAAAARHHQLVRLGLAEKTLRFEIGEHTLACVKAIKSAIRRGGVVVDFCVQREDADGFELMPHAHLIVVEIMRRGDFHAAGAEGGINVIIGDDGNHAAC